MSVVQIVEPKTDIRAAMREIGAKARAAAREVANAPAEKKNRALFAGARILRERVGDILAANELDCEDVRAKDLSAALIDRLTLNSTRIEAIALGLFALVVALSLRLYSTGTNRMLTGAGTSSTWPVGFNCPLF